MIGFFVGEDDTYFEAFPIFANNSFGFKIKLPFHFGIRKSGEYGFAFSKLGMWTMWKHTGYPLNPISVIWNKVIKKGKQ